MTADQIYHYLLWFIFIISALTFVATLLFTNPYGRFMPKDQRFTIASLPGWLIMEFPCVVVFAWTFSYGENRAALVPLVFLCIWQSHYFFASATHRLRPHAFFSFPNVGRIIS